MATGPPPNYYAILGISATASKGQIRDAYKRAALKTHPDRVPADSPERAERTRKFQLVNDAYYTLSDDARRRDYDAQRDIYGQSSTGSTMPSDADPFAEPNGPGGAGTAHNGAGGFSWAWNFFGNQRTDGQQRNNAEEDQFGDVFEEMLREEGVQGPQHQQQSSIWSILGTMSGITLGYIVGNIPGAVAGAAAGNQLGRVRDHHKKSVYSVFQELPEDARMRVLSQLAAKVFSHTVGA